MAGGVSRMPVASEMNVLQAEVGGDQDFMAAGRAQDGAIVTDTAHQRMGTRSGRTGDA